jgi:hypothetical protein
VAQKAPSFGKRGVQSSASRAMAQASRGASEISSTGVPLSELAKSLMAQTVGDSASTEPLKKAGVVPRSWRAGILAGLLVSAMQAGFVIIKAKTGADPTTAGLLQMAGVDPDKALPLLLAGSLLSGAQATASTILFAHWALRRLNNASFIAYGIGGGIAAGALAYAAQALGLAEMEHGLALEIATGAAAGFFYRMFAGARA